MKGRLSLLLLGMPPSNALFVKFADGKQVRISADGEADTVVEADGEVDSVDSGEFDAKQREGVGMLQSKYPYYHTGEQIREKLQLLQSNCKNADVTFKTHRKGAGNYAVHIDEVKIRKKGTYASPHHMFLLFGEHAREVISPESGLHFAQSLCDGYGSQALDTTSFTIIPNGNPGSRHKVEGGDFCLRVNPRGVDLNRNWDEHFEHDLGDMGSDVFPGKKAFSEPESQIFKELLAKSNATSFVTIHSGTLGMYQPPAYDMALDDPTPKGRRSKRILEALDEKYCQCPFGAAGKEVGYSCPGTCLDYAWDKLNLLAFAFEIYTDPLWGSDLKRRFADIRERMHKDDKEKLMMLANHANTTKLFTDHPSHFVSLAQVDQKAIAEEQSKEIDCAFSQFNPVSKSEYDKTVDNWTKVYTDLAMKIANKDF